MSKFWAERSETDLDEVDSAAFAELDVLREDAKTLSDEIARLRSARPKQFNTVMRKFCYQLTHEIDTHPGLKSRETHLETKNSLHSLITMTTQVLLKPTATDLNYLGSKYSAFCSPCYKEKAMEIEAQCVTAANKLVSGSDDTTAKRKRSNSPAPTSKVLITSEENPDNTQVEPPTEMDQSGPSNEITTENDPHFKPLPFFVKCDGKWSSFIANLNALLSSPISASMLGDSAKIIPKTAEDFRVTQRFLIDGKYEFSTITPKAERPRKVAIRGIPHQIAPEEIRTALNDLNFKVMSVQNISNRKTKQCYNLFQVLLYPSPDWDKVYKITELLHLKVNIRPFTNRGKRTPQCHRCQRYGHSSWSCNYAARCVKCAANHLSAKCDKPRDSAPTCCLCTGAHTANFSGCPAAPKNVSSAKATPEPPQDAAPATVAPSASVQPSPDSAVPETAPKPATEALPKPTYAQATKKPKKARKPRAPANVAPVEEMEVAAPALESLGQADLPSETKELMRDFCSCVSEVRAWFQGTNPIDVLNLIKGFQSPNVSASCSGSLYDFVRDLDSGFHNPENDSIYKKFNMFDEVYNKYFPMSGS